MRSLNTGFDELHALVQDFDFEVIGVTETWLDPYTPSLSYEMPGYTFLRADRSPQPGGGVAVYIKDCLRFERVELAEVDPSIEHISLIVRMRECKLGVAIVYRPPDVNYTCLKSLFQSFFVDMAVEVNSDVCLGDINVDLMSNTCSAAGYLRRLIKSHNVVQHISEPTRVTSTSETLIDHLIADKATKVEKCGVIDTSSIIDHRGLRITDHRLIYCDLRFEQEKTQAKLIRYRDYSKFNLNETLAMAAEVDWNRVCDLSGVDDIEYFIASNVKSIFDKHGPIVTKRVTKNKAPWRTREVIELTKLKTRLKRQFLRNQNDANWSEYKRVRNTLNSAIRSAKKRYFEDKLANCRDSSIFWKCLRQNGIVGSKDQKLPPNMNTNDINKYFTEMGTSCEPDEALEQFYDTNRKGRTN
ncbi:uncharacterized protein LOC124363602 [Homalodisca vitripennis]|uniref:uncharacterized protein LOC124363602 n=1 Tax=Homalodisca vitripennis TaxID=197043 RepID=UPI001EECF17F|nr:uncharacterized protein LOC124363602 [Homalodisca vitripennis]